MEVKISLELNDNSEVKRLQKEMIRFKRRIEHIIKKNISFELNLRDLKNNRLYRLKSKNL